MGNVAACPYNSSIRAAVDGGLKTNGHHQMTTMSAAVDSKADFNGGFQMPLHYPRYNKSDYEKMPEWRIDGLLKEYGLPVGGDILHKRKFAMGAFLWPDQLLN
ncbi:hypothetical protein ACP275_05G111800 [Erythranthe tilingii]